MTADPDAIQLTAYELVLLRHTRQGRDFDEKRKERIFREHLAYTLGLIASGEQLAAGPFPTDPPRTRTSAGSACSGRARSMRSAS